MSHIDRRKFLFYLSGLAILGPGLWAGTSGIYTVRKGDTLTRIARRNGTTVAELKRANGLRGDRIIIGQKLRIPSTSDVLAPVMAATRQIRVDRSKWKYIVAHHSATSQGNATSFDRVDRRHMKNGLAYHFVIGNGTQSEDGAIEVGSRWTRQLHGGHVSKWEFNNHGIGICLVGNFEKTRPTAKQLSSFKSLTQYLGGDLLNNRYQFFVHKEINPTLCPGRYFPTTSMHRIFG